MANSTPYDYTTTPPYPQSGYQSQIPQGSCAVTKWRAQVPPGRSPPPYATSYTSRPAPREGQAVAQDVDLFDIRTRCVSLSDRDKPGYFDFLKQRPTKLGTQGGLPEHTSLPDKQPNQHSQTMELGLDPPPNLRIERLPDDVPMNPTTPKLVRPPSLSTGQLTMKVNSSTNTNSTLTAKLRRPRLPGNIFDVSFSFTAPSHRHVSDLTPPISPRTSISSDSSSPTPTPEEPFKRQRIEPSTTTPRSAQQTAPVNLSATHKSANFNAASAPLGPSTSWCLRDPLEFKDPKRFGIAVTHIEPHPGTLIDFSAATKSLEAIRQKREEEEYHDYLDQVRRHNDLPSPDEPRTLFDMDVEEQEQLSSQQRELLGKGMRLFGLEADVHGRRRACSMNPTLLKSPTSSSSANQYSGARPGSSSSDPSMDRFLTHVRASQEARAAKLRQQIFRNGETKGWLGDEPL
ncbi:hypothetical protein DE146DRAFT_634026 [Phaeosphaeria sp. MPI-PUGE-AT-0046c]|nr:hypothetical protein DE146DRAFT_634026 [Phaeosphaeria sp. MPI-PUGE-AT-0046c]